MTDEFTDPKELGGDIVSTENTDGEEVLIDTRRSVLLDGIQVALITDGETDDQLAIKLFGRRNHDEEPVRILFICSLVGAQTIAASLVRIGGLDGGFLGRVIDEALKMETKGRP